MNAFSIHTAIFLAAIMAGCTPSSDEPEPRTFDANSSNETDASRTDARINPDSLQIGIDYPSEGAVLPPGAYYFRASVVGPGAEALPESSLSWSSDVDGHIGTGRMPLISLSAGPHIISLVANDSLGIPHSAAVNVKIDSLDRLKHFEMQPFVLRAEAGAQTRVIVSPIPRDVTKISIARSEFGPQFGVGMLDLVDDGLGADEIAEDNLFSAYLSITSLPEGADCGQCETSLQLIDITLHYSDGSEESFSENVSYIFAMLAKAEDVPINAVADGIWVSGRTMNIVEPSGIVDKYPVLVTRDLDRIIANHIYANYKDIFDWIIFTNIYSNRNGASGTYKVVKNEVEGIGEPLSDETLIYGSKGRLRGIIRLIVTSSPNIRSHEVLHTWAVGPEFMSKFRSAYPHWSGIENGSSMFNLANGGRDLVDLGDGLYRLCGLNSRAANKLELYLMGVLPISDLGEFRFVQDPVFVRTEPFAGCGASGMRVFRGTGIGVINEQTLTQLFGARDPGYPDQSQFRALSVVISDRLLTPDEWIYMERAATLHEESFRSATGNRAEIDYALTSEDLP